MAPQKTLLYLTQLLREDYVAIDHWDSELQERKSYANLYAVGLYVLNVMKQKEEDYFKTFEIYPLVLEFFCLYFLIQKINDQSTRQVDKLEEYYEVK